MNQEEKTNNYADDLKLQYDTIPALKDKIRQLEKANASLRHCLSVIMTNSNDSAIIRLAGKELNKLAEQ